MTRRLPSFLVALLALLILAPLVGAEDSGTKVGDLDARAKKALVKAAREYFDPDVEFLYGPRKELLAQFKALQEKGIEPLQDIGFMKSLVYEGRRFLPRFSDKKWRKLNNVDDWKQTQGLYNNLKSPTLQLSFTVPKGYPNERGLDRKREPAFPILMVFPEAKDGVTKSRQTEPYPGSAALARLYPKKVFASLYEEGFLLAPVAPRAEFVEEDGRVRHRFSTRVLTDFWRRYQIDFDRIVLDGRIEAAALASVFPHVFAGVVLRGGDIPAAMITNISTIPIYVVGDADLKKALDAAGHPNVTFGDEKGLMPWLKEQKKTTPKKFSWRVPTPEHLFANWIKVGEAQIGPDTGLEVEVIDTEENPNTIKIDGKGIESIAFYLNDDIVDLDREVNLLLNGKGSSLGKLKREFAQFFERPPNTRKNMYFGWLFSSFVPGIKLPAPVVKAPPAVEEKPVVGDPALERKAQKYWDKAVAAESDGDKGLARQRYQAVVDVGATSFRKKALDKLEELKE